MKKLVMGILAHVDAGKTTLSEALLYESGSIRKLGRVDKKDAFLDTHEMERARGITIFSKQAQISLTSAQISLLDTPGHVDFSSEMERTLQVLDYSILVINGADGIQAHTRTLWRLLKKYEIPVFLFVNKMDQSLAEKEKLLEELKEGLHENCIDFSTKDTAGLHEEIAVCEENVLEFFLEEGKVAEEDICRLILHRKIFPCYFGSALKLWGVKEFLAGIERYTLMPSYGREFGAKVFKITRDSQGNRLTYLKVTGGRLKVRERISEEKVNQIRVYSGEKFEILEEAGAGSICAVTGLAETYPGQGLGVEESYFKPALEPVLTYGLHLPEGVDARWILPKLKELEEEDPQLHILWEEKLQEIQVQLMGEVQMEILQNLIEGRFGTPVSFGEGRILYKETIEGKALGMGHFEPLRHYAEVHLLLEAGKPGSGLVYDSDCSEEELEKSWQRLVLSHLKEKEHRGVLTGTAITDMKITLVAGRAHQKHTQGGDFRQAAYRALRQGLMMASSLLLEPYYEFLLEIPSAMAGRAMVDLEQRNAVFGQPWQDDERVILKGSAPVSSMRGYQKEVLAYTKGLGRLSLSVHGYGICHNSQEVIEKFGYDPKRDLENPPDSVFCAHGAGFVVEWDQAPEYMHVENSLLKSESGSPGTISGVRSQIQKEKNREITESIGTEEIDAILERTYFSNRRSEKVPEGWKKGRKTEEGGSSASKGPVVRSYQGEKKKQEYLLVDGYNIIFAWEDLKEVAKVNIDGARGMLMDILSNYQAIKGYHILLVFDAYRVQGHQTEMIEYHNIRVIYTKEAETADQYIERFAHENREKYNMTVATSDGLEQIIIRGQGCGLLSARELREEVLRANEDIQTAYREKQKDTKNYLNTHISLP